MPENTNLAPPKLFNAMCENLVNARFGDLSEGNIKCFKDRLLDMTGCIIGGAIVEDNNVLTELFRKWGGMEEAPVFLQGFRAPRNNAALINCLLARSNDFGSITFNVLGERVTAHMGETLIPLGLTLADIYGVSGEEFMINSIAAEDLTGRILYTCVNRFPFDMLLGSTAAAAEVSRYYKLDVEQTKAALSYAATNSTDPANTYYDRSQEFKYHNGESARCGIMSCELAKGGWTGLKDPFYGHWGLAVRDTNGELPPKYKNAFADLGKVYFTEGSFKLFPGGMPTQNAILAAIKVRSMYEGRYKVSDIKKVEVERAENSEHNYYSDPFTSLTQANALFCYQFQVCCALYHGTVKAEYSQTRAIRENETLVDLVGKSTMGIYKLDEKKSGMLVRVTMNDGSVFEASEPYATITKYPSQEMLINKFMDQFNAFGKLPKSRAEKIIELALNIEKLSDMREYTSLLQI